MKSLPIKALKKSQLTRIGVALNDSSHQTYKASFKENGKEIFGFYKELAPQKDYGELLAKISVAVSLLKKLSQGKRSAEERLVFDEHNKLSGTFSIGVDNFRPLNFSSEPIPCDPTIKEQVIPSTKTLIKENIMEILFMRHFLNDDDVHPHNISLAGDIDFDMFFYWFTIYIKEPRLFVGVTNTHSNLNVPDWETFPRLKNSTPFHWPTHKYPGKESIPKVVPGQGMILNQILPKIYTDPAQFANLAGEAEAQEQKLAAALKILITYQPEMMRQHLTQLFGDMTLNYSSLEEKSKELRETYEKAFPKLCNSETDKKSFIDFILTIYQEHYDNLYRVVVFYMGCENNGFNVPLPATHEALYLKPSFYRNIEIWVRQQNETVYAKEGKHLQYNLDELQKRYHQIWRDAFAPSLKDLLHGSYSLTNKILRKVTNKADLHEAIGRRPSDANVVSAWQLFGTMPEISINQINQLIVVDKESNLREAMLYLAQFTKDFHDATKDYYEKARENLTAEDNRIFCEKLNKLYASHNLSIRKELVEKLGHTSSFAKEFNEIATNLHQLIDRVNFMVHLTTNDEFMRNMSSSSGSRDEVKIDSEELLIKYNRSLFNWAKCLRPDLFDQYIIDIINKHYVSHISASRLREQPVKDYLLASKNVPGDIRLAYILSSGNEDGLLNKQLIKYLTPFMLETEKLGPISEAIRNRTFFDKIDTYTKSTTHFAKHNPEFIHLYSDKGIPLFYKTMYAWVGKLERAKFIGLVESALKEYKSNLFWGSSTRESEVRGYYTYSDQAKIVALIFQNGTATSTLNKVLFQKICEVMKKDIAKKAAKSDKLLSAGDQLFMDYDEKEHGHLFVFELLLEHSAGPSHGIESAAQLETAKI